MYKIILDKNKIVQDSIDNIVISPILTEKLNGVPTLKYTIPYSDKYYQDYQRRISKIEVKYDDVSKFKGRLLNGRLLFNGNKELTFEGELAFLNDIQYPPYEFEGDYGDLFKDVLNYYNSKCDKDKRFNVGQITMTDSNNYITRSSETYSSCWNVISEKILSYGGYIKLRYVGDERYLDLLYESGVVTKQKIEFGENLLDLEEYIDSSEIATVVIPLGAKKNDTKELNDNIQRTYTAERIDIRSVNNGKLCIESKLVKKLGRVERVVNWDDVTIPSNLLTKAKKKCDELILENQSITAKAIDLHYAENDTPYFKIGDIIPILSKPHNIETTAILTERTTYLNDPTQDTFSLGTEKKTLTSSVNASSNAADDTAEKITGNFINEVIKKQTQLITNGKNGNVLYGYNEKGKLSEICFMDTDDFNTAMNILRLNQNGIGFSTNGYSGPYRSAWTIDGRFNADFITAGILRGIEIIGGSINVNDKFKVDSKGNLTAIDGNFNGTITGSTIKGGIVDGATILSKTTTTSLSISGGRIGFKYGDINVGYIGTNQMINTPTAKGLVFDLETDGSYMCWANRDGTTYTAKLIYSAKAFEDYTADRVNVGCDLDMRGNTLRNVKFEGKGITGALNFVQVKEVNSNGTLQKWSNNCKLEFKNGILVSGSAWSDS